MKTTFLTIVLALMCSGVRAQTAEFKCPTPGTTVEFTGSGQTVWLAQQGQMCVSAKDVTVPVELLPTTGSRQRCRNLRINRRPFPSRLSRGSSGLCLSAGRFPCAMRDPAMRPASL